MPTKTTNGGRSHDRKQVCSVCGTAYEGNVNEVVEMEEGMLVGISRRRIRKDNVRKKWRCCFFGGGRGERRGSFAEGETSRVGEEIVR